MEPTTRLAPWAAVACYLLTSAVPMAGLAVGRASLPLQSPALVYDRKAPFANWDGWWYEKITRDGYSVDSRAQCSVAFFPAYPLAGRLLAGATGLDAKWALLVVAHICLAASFVVLGEYARLRFGDAPARYVLLVLLSFGLLPITFFFRMTYSEPLFFLCAALALYGMERRWSLGILAGVIGLASATRPVGVALLPPLALHIWARSTTRRSGLAALATFLPLAGWGLGAYMVYQWNAFDDPFAFVKAQDHWRAQAPIPLGEKLLALAALEPVVDVFDSSSPCYWRNQQTDGNPFLSWRLANPLWWLLAGGLIVLGASTSWLNAAEVSLAAGLLLIPYILKGHEMCMSSMGRFAAVVPPVYLVLAHLFLRTPTVGVWAILAACGVLLGVYSAMFAAWYPFF